MSAVEGPNSRRYAVRPVVMMTACIAALLLAIPLFTLEADARGGGGGGGRGGGFGGRGFGGHGGFAARGFGGARSFGGAHFGGARLGARPFGVAHFRGTRFGARPFGVAHVGGSRIAAGSFSRHNFAGRPVTSARGVATARISGGRYQTLTPTGRVEAMEKRLDATLGAVKSVQPALVKFYDSLSDEQKARFNSLRSVSQPVG